MSAAAGMDKPFGIACKPACSCPTDYFTAFLTAELILIFYLSCGFNIYESIRILKMMDEEKKMKKKEKEDIDDGSHITID